MFSVFICILGAVVGWLSGIPLKEESSLPKFILKNLLDLTDLCLFFNISLCHCIKTLNSEGKARKLFCMNLANK